MNPDRSIFIHTQAFYFIFLVNDHIIQNKPGSLNILHLNVPWSKDTGPSADWLMNDEEVR